MKRGVKHLMRLSTHRSYRKKDIVRGLHTLDVQAGGIVLVHSSLSALGHVWGGARTVIEALKTTIGSQGTLVMPTHSWSQMSKGCTTFDAVHTPSCVGRITNEFLRLPGVVRSLHPTHSVAAYGPFAERLVCDHAKASSPCGAGTPYARIMELNGQILFLGVSLHVNTCFHGIEALARLDYLLRELPEEFEVVDSKGIRSKATIRRHQPGVARRFAAVEELLEGRGILRRGPIGAAESRLVESRSMRDLVLERLQNDPCFLLEGGCKVGAG